MVASATGAQRDEYDANIVRRYIDLADFTKPKCVSKPPNTCGVFRIGEQVSNCIY